MKIRAWLEKRAFENDLKRARKAFQKVTRKAEALRMGKKEKRSLFKTLIRACGYKKIRIMERD